MAILGSARARGRRRPMEGSRWQHAAGNEQPAAVEPGDPQPVFVPAGSGRVLDFLGVTHRLTSEAIRGCHLHLRIVVRAGRRQPAPRAQPRRRDRVCARGGAGGSPPRSDRHPGGGRRGTPAEGPSPCDPQSARAVIALPVPGRSRWDRPVVRCCRRGQRHRVPSTMGCTEGSPTSSGSAGWSSGVGRPAGRASWGPRRAACDQRRDPTTALDYTSGIKGG